MRGRRRAAHRGRPRGWPAHAAFPCAHGARHSHPLTLVRADSVPRALAPPRSYTYLRINFSAPGQGLGTAKEAGELAESLKLKDSIRELTLRARDPRNLANACAPLACRPCARAVPAPRPSLGACPLPPAERARAESAGRGARLTGMRRSGRSPVRRALAGSG